MSNNQQLLEKCPLAIAVTEGPEHEIRYANPAFCQLLGKQPSILLGRPFADVLQPPDMDKVSALLDSASANGGEHITSNFKQDEPGHGPVYRSFAVWPIPDEEDHADRIAVQVTDSTEQVLFDIRCEQLNDELRHINENLVISSVRQQELAEAAATAEQRLRDLLHGLGAIVYEVDIETNHIGYISQQDEPFLGYPISRFRNADFWSDVIHPDDFRSISTFIRDCLAEGRDHEYEFRALAADGSVVWLRNIIRVVPGSVGRPAAIRGVIIDITRQRSAEEAFERERRIANALQNAILQYVPEDAFPGLEVTTLYEPALDEALVGGDFFDVFRLPDERVLLMIGDVTGKGLTAATRTAEVKFALRAFAQVDPNPAAIVSRLNDFMCAFYPPDSGGDALIVLSVLVVDPVSGVTRVTPAGTEPPLVMRASGDLEQIPPQGMILGAEAGSIYTRADLTLAVGDMVIMTTDGVTEARRGFDLFGYDRMAQAALDARMSGSPREVGRAIVAAARDFAGGTFHDDVCLVAIKRA